MTVSIPDNARAVLGCTGLEILRTSLLHVITVKLIQINPSSSGEYKLSRVLLYNYIHE